MVSHLLIAVGFLAAVAAVIALARGSTARWERDRRARVAVRADDRPRRTSPAGSWMPSAAARRAVDSVRRSAVGLGSGLLGRLRRKGSGQGPPARPVAGAVGGRPSALVGRILRRGQRTTSLPGRAVLRRMPRVRRRALALLHRHGPPDDVPQEEEVDRPTTR